MKVSMFLCIPKGSSASKRGRSLVRASACFGKAPHSTFSKPFSGFESFAQVSVRSKMSFVAVPPLLCNHSQPQTPALCSTRSPAQHRQAQTHVLPMTHAHRHVCAPHWGDAAEGDPCSAQPLSSPSTAASEGRGEPPLALLSGSRSTSRMKSSFRNRKPTMEKR